MVFKAFQNLYADNKNRQTGRNLANIYFRQKIAQLVAGKKSNGLNLNIQMLTSNAHFLTNWIILNIYDVFNMTLLKQLKK